MGTGALRRDQLVYIDGIEHRLMSLVTDTCWELQRSNDRRTQQMETNDLLKLLGAKRLTFPVKVNREVIGAADCNITTNIAEEIKVRRMYVKAAMGVPNSRKRLEEAIDLVWNQIKLPKQKPGWVTVYRWRLRYMRAGEDYRALMDNHKLKGCRKSRFEAEVVDLCRDAINEKYLKREGWNIQRTLDHALIKFQRENQLRPKDLKLKKAPTRRLIKRLLDALPAFDKCVARNGFPAAQRVFRSVSGHIAVGAPLDRVEIDHTLLDLIVLDDQTLQPAGRPWITACIDVYSRCILGIYIGFIPPSEQTVAKCLNDCFRPKDMLRNEFPSIKHVWPAYGKMHELVVDNGLEFHSNRLEQICGSINIDLKYSPRKQAWFKGHIERFFGTLNQFVHGIPGTTYSNPVEKGDYNSVKQASLTNSEAKAIILKWIADCYHQSVHDGLDTTPVKMWDSAIGLADIPLTDSFDDLDLLMAKPYTRVLTHNGIEFETLVYNSPEVQALRRKYGEKFEVEIRVDEDNLGSIKVIDPKSSAVYTANAIDFKYANGISLHQHELYKEQKKKRESGDRNSPDLLAAKEELDSEIQKTAAANRHKIRKHAARYKEESARAKQKVDAAREAACVDEPNIASPRGDLRQSQQPEDEEQVMAPVLGFKPRREEFTPIYKEGY